MSNSTKTPGVDTQEWAQAVSKAKEAGASVAEMATHAAAAVGAMANQAACDVGKTVDELAARAGVGIQDLGDRLSKDAPHAGIFRNPSRAVAGVVKEGGEYLQAAKLTGMTHDVAHVIRRNPIPAVLIAIGFGWLLRRSLKG